MATKFKLDSILSLFYKILHCGIVSWFLKSFKMESLMADDKTAADTAAPATPADATNETSAPASPVFLVAPQLASDFAEGSVTVIAHDTLEDATADANTQAEAKPGTTFSVFEERRTALVPPSKAVDTDLAQK